jgi:hypothetical protein
MPGTVRRFLPYTPDQLFDLSPMSLTTRFCPGKRGPSLNGETEMVADLMSASTLSRSGSGRVTHSGRHICVDYIEGRSNI